MATQEQIRKAKDEKWHRGDLRFKLHKAQILIDDKYKSIPNQLFVGNCSRQFGKSFWAVTKAIEMAMSKPNAEVRYGAAFQSDLVDFIIPAFEKVMEDCPAHLKGKYTKVGSKFMFPNGSRIKLVGLDKNPNGLRGNTLDLIILDECAFVSNLDYVYKSVIMPATMHRPNAKIILISTPPSTPAHAFLDYAQRAEVEGAYSKFTIFDNPMVTEETIARLMRESGGAASTTWRREYLGEFLTDSELQIIPEWKDEYVVDFPRDQYWEMYHKYVGMDLGVKDQTALIFGYYDFRKATLVLTGEFVMNGPSMNTIKLVEAIKAKEKEQWGELPVFRRISDNNNLHLLQDLGSLHNIHFHATNKDTLEAMINEVRVLVQNGRIVVHPSCVQMVGCLKYGVWNTKKSEFARSQVYGHFDMLASLIYLVRNLSVNSNPIPLDHGFENHKAWLGNVKHDPNNTQNGRTLAKALVPKTHKLKY